jgi:hypothetical protein
LEGNNLCRALFGGQEIVQEPGVARQGRQFELCWLCNNCLM